jgi:hypothetical protein
MGLGRVVVEAIVREHQFRPIVGDVLVIGRQTVYLSAIQLVELLAENGFKTENIRPDLIEIDRTTIDRRGGGGTDTQSFVTDRALFEALSQSTFSLSPNVMALDVSAYEGAEIIHNLNEPVPENLRGIADFIVDGSTLDNTFNAALTLMNYSEMLRPGGRLLAVNAFSPHNTPYAIMPPQTFLDYFIVNQFTDCKAYTLVYENVPHNPALNVFYVDLATLRQRKREMTRFVSPLPMASLIFAEKGSQSTTQHIPIQQDYRSSEQWNEYIDNLEFMLNASRPHLARSSTEKLIVEPCGGHILVNRRYQLAWS